MTLTDRLKEFMERTVCYGAADAGALADCAAAAGCETLKALLEGYAQALREGDREAALRRFAALHFFTYM